MDAQEAWLEQHTIYCERNAARLRPAVCEERRKEDHLTCRGCVQVVVSESVVPVEIVPRREKIILGNRKMVMNKKEQKPAAVVRAKAAPRQCVTCQRVMPITGKGMCGKCYYLSRRAENSPQRLEINGAAQVSLPADWRDKFADAPKVVAAVGPDATESGLNAFADCLAIELSEVSRLLLAKNLAYGNSALDPVRIFSKANPVEQIRVRLDDKLSRLMRGGADDGEDTEFDLLGYLLLLRVAKRMAA